MARYAGGLHSTRQDPRNQLSTDSDAWYDGWSDFPTALPPVGETSHARLAPPHTPLS